MKHLKTCQKNLQQKRRTKSWLSSLFELISFHYFYIVFTSLNKKQLLLLTFEVFLRSLRYLIYKDEIYKDKIIKYAIACLHFLRHRSLLMVYYSLTTTY